MVVTAGGSFALWLLTYLFLVNIILVLLVRWQCSLPAPHCWRRRVGPRACWRSVGKPEAAVLLTSPCCSTSSRDQLQQCRPATVKCPNCALVIQVLLSSSDLAASRGDLSTRQSPPPGASRKWRLDVNPLGRPTAATTEGAGKGTTHNNANGNRTPGPARFRPCRKLASQIQEHQAPQHSAASLGPELLLLLAEEGREGDAGNLHDLRDGPSKTMRDGSAPGRKCEAETESAQGATRCALQVRDHP